MRPPGSSEASRDRFAELYDFSPVGYLTLSPTGEIQESNLTAAKQLGVDRRNLIGKKLSRFLAPEAHNPFFLHWRELADSETRQSCELKFRGAGGGFVGRLESVGAGDRETGGGRRLAALIDITERMEAEAALRRNERNLVDFFNEAPLGLIWLRPDGRILKMNRAQLELLGRETEDEVVNRPITEFLLDPELADDLLARLEKNTTIHDYRVRLLRKDGGFRHVLVDANGHWEDRRLAHTRWFVRDITRRVELEREILAISERVQRRIGEDLHDDLGQQLVGMEFVAQSLESQLRPLSAGAAARAGELTGMARRALVHARELAQGLSPIGLEAEGLQAALQELAARTRRIFRIDCRLEINAPVRIREPAVGIHLYRISQEAINNAIKHGKASRIDIGLTVNGERIVLAVRDNGIGLPKKPVKQKGMGLRIMQYRAGVIGGSLVAQRQTDGGMAFVCSVKNYRAAPRNPNPA